jgi:hypothetical protein
MKFVPKHEPPLLPLSIRGIAKNVIRYALLVGYPEDDWFEIQDEDGNVWDLNMWTNEEVSDTVWKEKPMGAVYPVIIGDPFNTTDKSKYYVIEGVE